MEKYMRPILINGQRTEHKTSVLTVEVARTKMVMRALVSRMRKLCLMSNSISLIAFYRAAARCGSQ